MNKKLVYGFIIFTILFMVVVLSIQPTSNELKVNHDNHTAYNYAEDFIKDRLKSPSTAMFPKWKERSNHIKYLGAGRYKIDSWVDSQNDFGAMIRSDWTCVIVFYGDKVKVESVKIE